MVAPTFFMDTLQKNNFFDNLSRGRPMAALCSYTGKESVANSIPVGWMPWERTDGTCQNNFFVLTLFFD
jgi:hypothetical protein